MALIGKGVAARGLDVAPEGSRLSCCVNANRSKLQETVEDRGACVLQFMELRRVGQDLATEQQQSS